MASTKIKLVPPSYSNKSDIYYEQYEIIGHMVCKVQQYLISRDTTIHSFTAYRVFAANTWDIQCFPSSSPVNQTNLLYLSLLLVASSLTEISSFLNVTKVDLYSSTVN